MKGLGFRSSLKALILTLALFGVSFAEDEVSPTTALESTAPKDANQNAPKSSKNQEADSKNLDKLASPPPALSSLEDLLRGGDSSVPDLKDLLNAASSNPSLQAQELLEQKAQKDYLASMLAFIPNLDARYNLNHTASSVPTSWATQNLQLLLAWNLDFATYKSMREKQALAGKGTQDSNHAKQSLYLQIIQHYYNYFSNEAILFTLEQKLERIKSDVGRVQKLYNQGLRTVADLESLKSQAALTEYQIKDAGLALKQSRLFLEYLTGMSIEKLRRVSIGEPTYELNERADIKSLEFQIQAQRQAAGQLHYFPSLSIQNAYTFNIQIPSFAEQLLSNPTGSVGGLAATYAKNTNVFGLSINYQLFSKIGQSVQKQSLTLATLANERLLAYKKREQQRDEELYRRAIQVAKEQISSAEVSLLSANLSYDNMKKRYEANLVTFTEYLQALSTKYDAESMLIQALNNYEIQKAGYIFYSGQNLNDYIE